MQFKLVVKLTNKDSQKTVDDVMVAIRAINEDPDKFKQAVRDVLEARKKLYMDTSEDVFENQLMRVHNLLQEKDEDFDLRLYKMYMRVKIYKERRWASWGSLRSNSNDPQCHGGVGART